MKHVPFEQDIKIMPVEEVLRGEFYSTSKRSVVYAGRHETIQEFIKSCEHEAIHGVLDYIAEEDDILMDMIHEHWIISRMMWADEFLL